MRRLQFLSSQKVVMGLLLSGFIVACSPQKKADKILHVAATVPSRLQEVYQISQQTSYPLFDCDTALSEIRIWESVGRITSTNALFMKANLVSMHTYYLTAKNEDRKKVIAAINQQEQIIDPIAEKEAPIFGTSGAPALTCREGVEAAIDSLFELGFVNMKSQSEEEDYTVGDGTAYIIEVRRRNFYKYVYYHNPELFHNESARKFIKIYRFLTQERWHNLAFDHLPKCY